MVLRRCGGDLFGCYCVCAAGAAVYGHYGFLCLVVSVVASVLDAAVALREENDLTI